MVSCEEGVGVEQHGRGPSGGAVRASLLVIAATGSGSAANFLFQWLAAGQLVHLFPEMRCHQNLLSDRMLEEAYG